MAHDLDADAEIQPVLAWILCKSLNCCFSGSENISGSLFFRSWVDANNVSRLEDAQVWLSNNYSLCSVIKTSMDDDFSEGRVHVALYRLTVSINVWNVLMFVMY